MKNLWLLMVLVTSFLLPVRAANTASGIPPFSQWPIISPVLRWLGTVSSEQVKPSPTPVPTPKITLYSIRTMSDLEAVQQLPKQKTVQLVANEADINTLIANRVAKIDGLDKLTVSLNNGKASAFVQIHRELLEENGVEIPFLKGDVFTAQGNVSFDVQSCNVRVKISSLIINGRDMGFTGLVQSLLNKRLSQYWLDEACVQSVTISSGEISVTGYRR